MPPKHAEMVHHMKRLLANVDAKTTSLADSVMQLPASRYIDAEYWQREVIELFHRRPITLALSCELPGPNTYTTLDVPGFRILVSRDEHGQAHAFFNACRHRGAPVAAGRGSMRRFTCPYHGWSYSCAGELMGVPAEKLFGQGPCAELNLHALKVEERHGLIFGVLDGDAELNLDDWLGDYGAELESIGLADFHVAWSHSFNGPNWKVCKDGFIENYHFASVHAKSLPTLIGNVNVTDTWGPHSRMLLPDREIKEQAKKAETEWDVPASFATVYYMFPATMIASCWGDWPLITRLFPGRSVEESTCVQTLLSRHPMTEERQAEADSFEAVYQSVTQNEDYVLDYAIQRGLENNPHRHFTLGRNEHALQHFHQSVAQFVAPPKNNR